MLAGRSVDPLDPQATEVEIDRKVLAAIAFDDAASFAVLVEKAKAALPAKAAA